MERDIGRVALRAEGKWWCAYLAKTESMDGAFMLSKMRLRSADEPKIRQAFFDLNRLIIGDAIAATHGQAPTWKEPQTAPDHERAPPADEKPRAFYGAIERAWRSWKAMALAVDTSDIANRDCELAFKAGAATLFWSVMKMLDPGDEPTDADLEKMAALSQEIEEFTKGFDRQWVDRVREGKP